MDRGVDQDAPQRDKPPAPARARALGADELNELLQVMHDVLRQLAATTDENIDSAVQQVLEAIGKRAKVDRSYVFLLDSATDMLRNTHEWCAEGIRPEIGNLQQVPFSTIHHWRSPLQLGQTIYIAQVSALPHSRQAERELLIAQGIQSLVVVPLLGPGHLHGFLGFDAVREQRVWPEAAQVGLRAVADVLVGGILRRQAVAALSGQERRFRALIQHSTDLVVIVGDDFSMRYCSPSACTLLGLKPQQPQLGSLLERIHPDDRAAFCAAIGEAQAHEGFPVPDFRLRGSCGDWIWFLGAATDLREDQAIGGVIINAHNIDDRKKAEQNLRNQATHDQLTGLPNRFLLGELLERAIARAKRTAQVIGVVFIDIDHFKLVNDALGHHVGDEVIKEAATRLRNALRGSDIVARFGGDEFVAIVDAEDAQRDPLITAAERLLAVFDEPFGHGAIDQSLSASAGIVFGDGQQSADELLRDADAAMYKAKEGGRGTIQCFDHSLREQLMDRIELFADLRKALDHGQLDVHYQPIFAAHGREMRGAEALLRWLHPARGWVSPADFVLLAEQRGLIIPIGSWVLDHTLAQLRQWRNEQVVDKDFFLAVNLSVHQLSSASFVDTVRRALARWQVPAQSLCLEVTESALMQEPQKSVAILQELRALGVGLAIDDFGTGYSSLAYLHELPVTKLKIDQRFIKSLGSNTRSQGIPQAVCTLAAQFGVKTVAEGVETAEQALTLEQIGCDLLQGFLLARPMPARQLEQQYAQSPRHSTVVS